MQIMLMKAKIMLEFEFNCLFEAPPHSSEALKMSFQEAKAGSTLPSFEIQNSNLISPRDKGHNK